MASLRPLFSACAPGDAVTVRCIRLSACGLSVRWYQRSASAVAARGVDARRHGGSTDGRAALTGSLTRVMVWRSVLSCRVGESQAGGASTAIPSRGRG